MHTFINVLQKRGKMKKKIIDTKKFLVIISTRNTELAKNSSVF